MEQRQHDLRGRRGAPAASPVHRVTDARGSFSQEQNGRMRKYLISMLVRTACVGLAVVTPRPWMWIFVVGAVLLPYVAVLIANAGAERRPGDFEHGGPAAPEAIGPPPQRSPIGPSRQEPPDTV